MKSKLTVALLLTLGTTLVVLAQTGTFPGLEKVMDRNSYEEAGLRKLSAEERAALDRFIGDYVSAKQKDAAAVAATEAVDRAVKERKVRAPDTFQSRIVGTYKGYGPRTTFRLENGQVWRPTNDEIVSVSPIDSPNVIFVHDMFGYKMWIEGAASVRVRRVQ